MRKTGIFGRKENGDVRYLERKLAERGMEICIVDFSEHPMNDRFFVSDNALVYNGRDLLDFDCFYLSEAGYIWPHPQMLPSEEDWKEGKDIFADLAANDRETRSIEFSFLEIVCDKLKTINPLDCFHKTGFIFHFYALLEKHGIPVPGYGVGNRGGFREMSLAGNEAYLDIGNKLPIGMGIEKPDGEILYFYVMGKEIAEVRAGDGKTVENWDREPGIKETLVKVMELTETDFGKVEVCFSGNGFYIINCVPSPELRTPGKKEDVLGDKVADFLMKECERQQ